MPSFATGLVVAALLSGATLWAMTEGTVTMVERSDTVSTLTEGVWHAGSPATMDAPVGAGG
jgi:hypothetical protein